MAWQVWTPKVAVSRSAGKMTAAASRGERTVNHEHHHWRGAHLISSRRRRRYDDNGRWGFGGPSR